MAQKSQTQVVPHHESHGNSVAAWSAVGVLMVGFLLLTIAWVRADIALYIISGLVIVAGVVVGKVLAMMGFGEKHHDGT